jgi:hypothetical protein
MTHLKPPIPKEHGSWAMFIVPLLLGFIIAPAWHWQSLVLIVAAVGFFLVRYPLALLVKTRNRKRAKTDKTYLWRWAFIYGGLAALGGAWLVFVGQLWWLVPLGVFGSLLLGFHLWLVSRRQEMSVVGELVGIVGLALGAPMAYYTATGLLDGPAVILWLVNALYFGGAVFYIKLKVRRQPRQPAPTHLSQRLAKAKDCLIYQTLSLTLVILLVTLQHAPVLTPLTLLPATVKVVWGAWQWQDKQSLSLIRLGLIEIFHAVVFTVLMVIVFI